MTASRQDRRTRPETPPPPPDKSGLREAALAHLARFSATEHALAQVLERRILRWERLACERGADAPETSVTAAALRPLAREIARDMVKLGAVDDAAFARSRAGRLARSGRSKRMIQAQLAAKGIAVDVMDGAIEATFGSGEDSCDTELGAALVFARKRRVGPFEKETSASDTAEEKEGMVEGHRILAAFARAGFSRDIAQRALGMTREDAEDHILQMRSQA